MADFRGVGRERDKSGHSEHSSHSEKRIEFPGGAGVARQPNHTAGDKERNASTFLSVIDQGHDSSVQMTRGQSITSQGACSIAQYREINAGIKKHILCFFVVAQRRILKWKTYKPSKNSTAAGAKTKSLD